jgi:ankyrin repeat protein
LLFLFEQIPDTQGATPIHYACRFGKGRDIFSLFPLHQGLFQLKTVDNKTPFEVAAEYGHLDIIDQYLENPSDLRIRSLIYGAVRHHKSEMLSHIVSRENMNSYILQIACRQSHGHNLLTDQKISRFFTKDIMSKQISEDGFTPLMIAVKYRRKECVEELLKDKYCDRTILERISFDFERTVLHICAEFSNESITDALLNKAKSCALNLAPVDVMGNTPLHICAQKNNLYMCDKLLPIHENFSDLGSNSKSDSKRKTTNSIQIPEMLKIRNNNGLTALHEATQKGYDKIVERMIEAVTDPKILIEECDEQLNTSLHMAALKGKFEV